MNYYAQFNEDAILDGLFRKIGIRNKWCFEVGAGDGITLSNTRGFTEQGWKAILVEPNPKEFAKLEKNCPKDYCFNEAVTVDKKIDDLLARTDAPKDLDLVSIDIDGQDYYVWQDMEKYRPRVVVIEWSPYVDWEYLPLPNTCGNIGKNQAGLKTMIKLAQSKDYILAAITPVNLICIASECQVMEIITVDGVDYTVYE